MYNEDLDINPPISWLNFKKQISESIGVLFVTPEYNRSVPAVLKNAIDVGSRPYGKSVWNKMPSAIVSISPSALGAFGANHHLRQSLVFLNMPTMQQPEAYLGGASSLFNAQGDITQSNTSDFIEKFLNAYDVWVQKIASSN